MKYYFYSKTSAYLKVNGNYLGVINKNLTYAEIDGDFFIEFIPTNSHLRNAYYSNNASTSVASYLVDNVVLLIPVFESVKNRRYSVVTQKKFYNYTLTVISDVNVKFYVDGDISLTGELPFIPLDCNVTVINNYVVAYFSNEKHAVFVYSNDGVLLYNDVVERFNLDKNLTVIKKYDNGYPMTVKTVFTFNREFKSDDAQLLTDLKTVNEYFLPYVFLQSIKLNLNVNEILSDELINRKNDLLAFIGKVDGVIPPLTLKRNELLLIDGKGVKKAIFELKLGKISNIFIDDY